MNKCEINNMVGPRGLAFLLLCLVLVSQVDKSKACEAGQDISRKHDVTPGNEKEDPSQVQVYIVNGVGRVDGIYEEQGTPPLHYKRMGKANKYGSYYYLYQAPSSLIPGCWVLASRPGHQLRATEPLLEENRHHQKAVGSMCGMVDQAGTGERAERRGLT